MPDATERIELWRAMLPAQAPVASDIDIEDLARRFDMSGGYIRNAALRAAARLRRAGFSKTAGKGSHRKWVHPMGRIVVISGQEGHDAKKYQENEVQEAIAAVGSSKAD